MFLANSLNTKLQRSLSEFDITSCKQVKYPYTPKNQNPKVLFVKKNEDRLTSDELTNMTKEEYLQRFNLENLNNKFKRKFQINFDERHKKFSDDCMSERAKTAKVYIRDLLDNNLFEAKKRRWNNSTKPDDKTFRPPLNQTLFEVKNGLKDFNVVPLKEPKVEPGIDTKYEVSNPKEINWKASTKLELIEKKEIEKTNLEKAFNNTQKYWHRTELARENEEEMPIVEERKKVEPRRYYKPYKNPRALSAYNYEMMKQAKDSLWFEKEKVTRQVIHDNPGCGVKEKIESLVNKKMEKSYKHKFDLLTGKKKEKLQDNKYEWKDEEIIEKIQTLSNWKDTKWFDKICITCKNKDDLTLTLMDEEKKKQMLLKPLINKGSDLIKETNKIKDEKLAELKKKLKLEEIKRKTFGTKTLEGSISASNKRFSKYPMDKFVFENQDLLSEGSVLSSGGKTCTNFDLNNKEDDNNYFLEAYKNLLIKDDEERKKQIKIENYKRNKQWIEYKYFHPGIYVRISYIIFY